MQQVVDLAAQTLEIDLGRCGRVVVGQCHKPILKAVGRRGVGIRHAGRQRVRDPRPVGVVGRLEAGHVHDQVGQKSPRALFDQVTREDLRRPARPPPRGWPSPGRVRSSRCAVRPARKCPIERGVHGGACDTDV